MNGIKLIYIISRYYKSDEWISSLITTTTNEICDQIESILNI